MSKSSRKRRGGPSARRGAGARSRGDAFGLWQQRPAQREPTELDADALAALVPQLVNDGLMALDRGNVAALDDVAVAFAQVCAVPVARRIVVTHLGTALTEATTEAWQRGWQPADVHRYAGRVLGPAEQALAVDVMSLELRGYAPATVDRRWLGQLEELGADIWWAPSQTLFDAHRERGVDWLSLLTRSLSVLHLLVRLPRLELLTPLPGTVAPAASAGGTQVGDASMGSGAAAGAERPAVDERILSRVRQLLAKAESTTFEAEAETFTAGAQALMARHSIDAALLAASSDAGRGGDAPQGRRIGIDNPYDGPKAMLLNAVAAANRCSMVWSRELGFGTVVGFEADLESVELLFTSLLVQATRAVTSAGSRTDVYGRSRTRSFRQSFLSAYAHRIGERLEQVMADEVDAAAAAEAGGRELVPLLTARTEEVKRVVEDWFPTVRSQTVRTGRDAEGWHSGRAAADRAHLGAGDEIGSS